MPCKRFFIVFFSLVHFSFSSSAQQPRLMIPMGHSASGSISEIKFSPDRKYFVTVAKGKDLIGRTVKGWHSKTGKLLYSYTGIRQVFFTANNKNMFILFDDGKCRFIDKNSGDIIYTLAEDTAKITFFRLSPDNLHFVIISSAYEGNMIIREIKTGRQIQRLTIETTSSWLPPSRGNFSPDGKCIITQVGGREPLLFNVRTGLLVSKLNEPSEFYATPLFSPDGKRILTISDDTAYLWEARTGRAQKKLFIQKGAGPDYELLFSPDSKYLLGYFKTFSRDSLKVFSISSGKLLYTKAMSDHALSAVPITTNNKIVLVGDDNIIRILNIETGIQSDSLILEYKGRAVPVTEVLLSRSEKYLIARGIDQEMVIITRDNPGKKWGVDEYKEGGIISLVQLSNDEKYVEEFLSDYTLKVWDIATGKLKNKYYLKGKTANITSADISGDADGLITGTADGQVKVWDMKLGKMVHSINSNTNEVTLARYSNDNRYFITSSHWSKTAVVWESKTGRPLSLLAHPNTVISADFSPDGNFIATGCGNGNTMIWKRETGALLSTLVGEEEPIRSVQFNYNGTLLLTNNSQVETGLKLWDVASGKQLCVFASSLFSASALISPVNKNVMMSTEIGRVKFYNMESCKLITEMELDEFVSSVKYTEDGRYMMFRWKNDSITLFNHVNAKPEREIYFPHLYQEMIFSRNGSCFFTTIDAALNVYDTEKFTLKYKLIALDSSDYIIQVPAGYYQCSAGAAKQLYYVTKSLKIITFEQLDVKYNRPDKVLEAIGSSDTALIKSYRKAWEKRIKKLGIDTTAFRDGYSVPESDFTNRDNIEYEQKDRKLKLNIKSFDSTYKLDRFNVWVNETPLYGQRGISLRSKNRNIFDSTININLSQGENRIETSITNVNGTESYRMPLQVNYTTANKETEKTYFIGIGIDQFVDSKYNLKYSTKDIRDLTKKLKEKYKEIIIDTLFNENVTISNIKALKQKLLKTTVNDKVIISYSGHGMLSKDFDYYLSTYAVNFDKPEENGLPYDELESLLDSIPARKKLMLIDACHSGEVDKDDLMAMNSLDTSKIKRGLKPVAYKNEGQLGLKNSFELMQSLFVNVGKSTGATIISAAAGTEFALEGIENLPNGVFTYCILEAMNKYPTMKISELKKIVGERVVEITRGLQKPTSRNETIAVDWEIW